MSNNGTLSTSLATGISLTPTGSYQSPFTITSTGIIDPASSGATGVYGSAVGGLTLINDGVINGGVVNSDNVLYSGRGVYLIGVGQFSNKGSITGGNGGSPSTRGIGISGGGGVDLNQAGTSLNTGTITGGLGGYSTYDIAGSGGFGADLTNGGTFTNHGSITGGNGGYGGGNANANGGYGGNGVAISNGVSFTNKASITGSNISFTITGGNGGGSRSGSGGDGGNGADVSAASFGNNAVITGGNGGFSNGSGDKGGDGGFGADLTNGGTFINKLHGSITGGYGGYGGNGSGGNGGNGVGLLSIGSGAGSFTNHGSITGGSGGNSGNGSGGNGGFGVDLLGSGAGSFTNYGSITGGLGGNSFYGGSGGSGGSGAYLSGGALLNSGLIAGAQGADAVQFGANASTLIVEQGATFIGSVVANSTIADVLAIGGTSVVSLVGLGTEYQNFHTLAFDIGATGNVSGTYTAFSGLNVISFAQGDSLVLDGFGATSDTYVSGAGLELGNGTSTITIDITGSFATSDFNVVDPPANTTISLNPPCFAAGTRILTTRGEIPVEQIEEGTPVILADGRIVPITWLGHRTVDIARHPTPETVRPVLIMAGAIGDGVPACDLYLSPDHALHLDGHLVPAKVLINGATIRQVDRRTVTYYHVELPEHAVLWAEGAPCESYLETGNRHAFESGGTSAIALHPAFGPATPDWQTIRETRSCAPLIEEGSVVEAIRARLLSRADIATTTDADLGITCQADGSIALTSRSAIPGHLNPDPRDRRRLGVKIRSIHRADGTAIPLDHPDLTQGWHDPEPDGRWTGGHALIPASLAGDGRPSITLAATLAYPADRKPADSRRRWIA